MPKRKSGLDVIFASPRSYVSLLYGVLTVVILFAVIFFGLKAFQQRSGTIGEDGVQIQESTVPTYVVKAGDSLWSIATAEYGDGNMWVQLAKANNLKNPSVIEKGTKLTLPSKNTLASANIPLTITPNPTNSMKPTVTPTSVPTATPQLRPVMKPGTMPNVMQVGSKITGNSYVVVRGDNLWNIAVRAYGDGFKWIEIARANHLANPRIIHAGNKFILPR